MGIISALFGAKPKKLPQMIDGVWGAAIGDIHGQLDQLNRLIDKLTAMASVSAAKQKILIFVGDYIDRGLKSRQVIDRLIGGFPGFEAHFLKGNHDETLLQFLQDETVGEAWRNYGGLETLASYGVARPKTGDWRQAQHELKVNLPPDHLKFFESLEMTYRLGDYIFVHAGLRPGIPINAQSAHDLMWIRDDFLNSNADFGGVVVHGHTPKEKPELRRNRIGIDTGAYMTGVLTAVVLEGSTQKFVSSKLD